MMLQHPLAATPYLLPQIPLVIVVGVEQEVGLNVESSGRLKWSCGWVKVGSGLPCGCMARVRAWPELLHACISAVVHLLWVN